VITFLLSVEAVLSSADARPGSNDKLRARQKNSVFIIVEITIAIEAIQVDLAATSPTIVAHLAVALRHIADFKSALRAPDVACP
jgi:hypothetical protein